MSEPDPDRELASSPCQAPPGFWDDEAAGAPMTEAGWLACTDPLPMLEFLRGAGRATGRKLRLFAVACSRRAWGRIDALGRAAVEVAEAFADGRAGADALRAARLACRSGGESAAWYAAATNPAVAARNAALSARGGVPEQAEAAAQADLLRDIFGNPLRTPPAVAPAGRAVLELARTIYDARRFAGLPALAGALEADGWDWPDLVAHCREPGRAHVRGCWALDVLLAGPDVR